jgi:hypothetical protein
MRSKWKTIVAAAAACAFVPQFAVANEAEGEQGGESSSGVVSFLESLDTSGWVSGSYTWDNEDVGGPLRAPNSFNLDQVWLSVGKAVDEESPVGFQLDVALGQVTNNQSTGGGSPSDIWVNQAYAEYFGPFNVTAQAGVFGTHIGYEVLGAPQNVNITRGMVWGLQPVDQAGVRFAGDLGPTTWMLGVTNGFTLDAPDPDSDKSLIYSLGFAEENWSLYHAGEVDFNFGPQKATQITLNVIAEIAPTDNILAWLDAVYLVQHDDSSGAGSPWQLGFSLGSRLGLTDAFGVGGRVEYIAFDADGVAAASDDDMFSFTATADYSLFQNLTIKGEFRYDKNLGSGSVAGGTTSDDNYLLGLQMYYEF